MDAKEEKTDTKWFLKAQCPVFWPKTDALTLPDDRFAAYLTQTVNSTRQQDDGPAKTDVDSDDGTFTMVSEQPSTTADARAELEKMAIGSPKATATANPTADANNKEDAAPAHPFMQGLLSHAAADAGPKETDLENKMLTDNGDVAFRSTKEALVDLFFELEEAVSAPRLLELLKLAWKDDALATLKIIFNARSIHLGKSSRLVFYRCAGWLAENHPLTLVANLGWLSRPVIQKKVEKKDEDLDDMVLIELEKDDSDAARFDVRNGVAHGYWKDLLNILALSVNEKLSVRANPREILNIEREVDPETGRKVKKTISQDAAKEMRRELRDMRHDAALDAFKNKPVHHALHLAVARLFAEQLKADIAVLRGDGAKAKRTISLCAKWAPSTARFHDKHTFIVSSIAEILYPESHFNPADLVAGDEKEKRTIYLRHAREAYRKDVAALRKHLDVVERSLSANTVGQVKYERVPSQAMNNYSGIFATKDTDRFEQYLDKVASGQAQISGATLMPSTLIKAVRTGSQSSAVVSSGCKKRSHKQMIADRMASIDAKKIDGQWNALVKRIKDSGTLQSSIAVCDVSGSMLSPTLADGTTPMDSSIGLSLLLAEVTAPPFGGAFITFSEKPAVEQVDLKGTLEEKYRSLASADWGMNTDFDAVFKKLILPMAKANKLAPEDMVKRVFVFSDMQFDEAIVDNSSRWAPKLGATGSSKWATSYERLQKEFKEAGYEMPELVFWNLAGGRAGNQGGGSWGGDPVAPKPVTADQEGVSLVSGYSQGMLKVFLEKGLFDEEEEREGVAMGEDAEDDLVAVEKTANKPRANPLQTVKKAISHKAYDMLKVED